MPSSGLIWQHGGNLPFWKNIHVWYHLFLFHQYIFFPTVKHWHVISEGWTLDNEKWNISCHISKPRRSQSSALAALQGELVNPEGTQEGKNTCHLAAIKLQPLPTVSPEETQDVKTQDTGYSRCLEFEPMIHSVSLDKWHKIPDSYDRFKSTW